MGSNRLIFRFHGLLFSAAVVPLAANPGPGSFAACIDYHCDEIQTVTLSDTEWQAIRSLFSSNRSAEIERQIIRRAVALLEAQVGEKTGTAADLAENRAGAGLPGQLDCIAESRNTTTYLHLLRDDRLLRWHRVEPRQVRHPWIFDTHWTAVIRDLSNNQAYAVDSWPLANGEPPYIQKIEQWVEGIPFDQSTD